MSKNKIEIGERLGLIILGIAWLVFILLLIKL